MSNIRYTVCIKGKIILLCISLVKHDAYRHLLLIYIMPTLSITYCLTWMGECMRDLNVVEYWHRVECLWKRSSYSHTLHSHSSLRWKQIHIKTQKEAQLAQGVMRLWPATTMVVFSFVLPPHWPPHTNTHTYIYSCTAAVLHYAITPTLWSVKALI